MLRVAMHLRPFDYVMFLTQPVLQTGVLVAMYKRNLQREYKYFFNYNILQVLTGISLFVLQKVNYTAYFYGYWFTLALCVCLSFAVFLELFRDAFRPYEALRDLSAILFRWSALVVLLVGGMWAVTSIHSFDPQAIMNMILMGNRSVRLMQCGMVFFLLLFTEYLGISRRNVMFGIAIGFGFFAAIDMLVATGLSHPTILRSMILRRIDLIAYNISILIWLAYAALPTTVRSRAVVVEKSQDANYALEDAREQPATESLLDTMDQTVERLLAAREEAKVTAAVASRAGAPALNQKI
jgi:hypothetical protein